MYIECFTGKDDKFWAGHFGVKMSGAEVRVKRETEANPDDKYCDLDLHVSLKLFVDVMQMLPYFCMLGLK